MALELIVIKFLINTKHHKDGHNELSKKHEHCCEGESFFNEFIPFNKQTRLCASVSSSDRGNVPAPIHVCPKCGDVQGKTEYKKDA